MTREALAKSKPDGEDAGAEAKLHLAQLGVVAVVA